MLELFLSIRALNNETDLNFEYDKLKINKIHKLAGLLFLHKNITFAKQIF